MCCLRNVVPVEMPTCQLARVATNNRSFSSNGIRWKKRGINLFSAHGIWDVQSMIQPSNQFPTLRATNSDQPTTLTNVMLRIHFAPPIMSKRCTTTSV